MPALLILGDIEGDGGWSVLAGLSRSWREHGDEAPLVIAHGGGLRGPAALTRDRLADLRRWGIAGVSLTPRAMATPRVHALLSEAETVIRPVNLPEGVPGQRCLQLPLAGDGWWWLAVHNFSECEGAEDPEESLRQVLGTIPATAPLLIEIQGAGLAEKRGLVGWLRRTWSGPVHWYGVGFGTEAGRDLTVDGLLNIADVGKIGYERAIDGEEPAVWWARYRREPVPSGRPLVGPVQVDALLVRIDPSGRRVAVTRWRGIGRAHV